MNWLNSIYYAMKPLLPVEARYAMRRVRAYFKMVSMKDWPIMESAAAKPEGWEGWPYGKQFALVLTHDVEGTLGLNRCLKLASLESRLGFRSSFNFVPEGEYRVSKELRDQLTADGFEVGVHDLSHNGSLYRSRATFNKAVPSINKYLNEWGAVGFRAGFMFHNLDWLRDLQIEYDASTFDTDPFEPQPEGVGTIFPMWVAGRRPGEGYVELPYTLPQDSTLFLILRDKAMAIWQEKLAWVAEHGGMVLLNVHPDYIAFDSKAGVSEFDSSVYEQFLQHVKLQYAGRYWHPLPKDMARFWRRRTHLGLSASR